MYSTSQIQPYLEVDFLQDANTSTGHGSNTRWMLEKNIKIALSMLQIDNLESFAFHIV